MKAAGSSRAAQLNTRGPSTTGRTPSILLHSAARQSVRAATPTRSRLGQVPPARVALGSLA
jgi:hypothetical protein